MLRSAPLFSFALHAAVLVIVGRWSYPTPPRGGSAESVVGVSFSAGAGGLLVESAPSPATEAAPTLLPPAPEFAPSTLAIETPPPELLTAATSPIPAPLIATAKPATARSLRTPPRGSRATSPALDAGGGSGAGSAQLTRSGTGRGGDASGYVPPQFRVRYKPAYPEAARTRRLEGTVLLLVSLDASGRVTEVAIHRSSGHGTLDQAALQAVRSWRFDPARQNGTAIATRVEIPIRFRFEERAATRA